MNDKIWHQQPQESNLQYERFLDFRNFNGKLNDYVEGEGVSNSGLTDNSLRKLAQKFNWIKRRNAFLIAEKKSTFPNVSQSVKSLEAVLLKLCDVASQSIDYKIENGIAEFQEGKNIEIFKLSKDIEILKFALSAFDKLPGIKQKLGYQDDDDLDDLENIISVIDTNVDVQDDKNE